MYRTNARVKGGRLYQSQADSSPIVVGTPSWFDWLEQHNAFLFIDRLGRFTAYKIDTDPDGQFWEAGRTHQGQQFRVHLGPSRELILKRLQAAAQTFAVLELTGESQVAPRSFKQRKSKNTTPADSPQSFLYTKLYRPRVSGDVIPRTRLIERLNDSFDRKATLVCAPAGYGKTTLVSEWVQTIERPVAWLTIDAGDNELTVFVGSLLAALQTVFPDSFATTAGLLSAPHLPPPLRIATLVVNDLATLPAGLVLVLDDYHTIHNHDVHTLIEKLIQYLPSQVHVVLISRLEPPLPLVTWLSKGYIDIVGHADLRFSLEETKDFLTRVLGNELANATAGALVEYTDGWIAVMCLAALSLQNTSDVAPFLERLRSCSDNAINKYLLEEVFNQQTPAVQSLLQHITILEQCCAELCVAISADGFTQEQVQTTLEYVASSTPFLVPLDDRQKWYRLHRLFVELLQKLLYEHQSAESVADMHKRASSWYARQGLIDEALRHALAGEDASGAAQLVETHFQWALEHEGWVQMERWLRVLPHEQVQRSPRLLLAQAWIMQTHGQVTDLPPVLTEVGQLLATIDVDEAEQADPLDRLLHTVCDICWCQFQYFTSMAQVSLESAQRALRWNPPGEEYLASLATMYLALSQQATGQEIMALVTLHEALLDHAKQDSTIARLLFAQALVFLAAGKLHQVEHIAGHLLQLAQQADLVLSQYYAHWLLGLVQYEWNNLDAAETHFFIVIEHRYQAHAWIVQEAMYGLALAYQARGLVAEAQKVGRDLIDYVQEQHSERDLFTAYAFCGQLTLLQDRVEAAERLLAMVGEPAELVGPMTSLEVPGVTRAWILLARGGATNVAEAQLLLTRHLAYVESIHSTRKTIQVLALQAWAFHLQNREAEALVALNRALVLARPGGILRTFADLPALFPLLQKLYAHSVKRSTTDLMDTYLKGVLVAVNPEGARAMFRKELRRQEGLES